MTSSPCEAAALPGFDQKLASHGRFPLTAVAVDTLQVNVGRLCNQACRHCHVDAGPHRIAASDNMSGEVVDQVIRVIRRHSMRTVDITGGAPELNPHFRRLVSAARETGARVIDRCNLTVLVQPGQEDLCAFLAAQRVEVIASLPYYVRERTDAQRGSGVFDASLAGLRLLNAAGYGTSGGSRDGLVLTLVYNPVGAYLPPEQPAVERDFRRELLRRWGIRFDQLFTITNMPIARFLDYLRRSGNEAAYHEKLVNAFNPVAADGVMCRSLVSVGPDGTLYDCDFNQMLDMPVVPEAPRHVRDFDAAVLARRRIVTDRHCFGCTAGSGSSCGGATV
jgi:radical SAM/Cys-rich protein